MPVAAAVGGTVLGGVLSSKGAKSAAKTQAAAADRASQVQQEMYEQTRQDLDPFRQAGTDALGRLVGLTNSNNSYVGTPFNFEESPSYQFRKQQGMDGIQQQAAAGGGLLSGATLKALNQHNSNLASQEHQQAFQNWQSQDNNAYNRHQTDQNNQYNRLWNLVGMGQNAAAQQGSAGMQTGQAVANNTMAAGEANSAAKLAQYGALGNGLGALIGMAI